MNESIQLYAQLVLESNTELCLIDSAHGGGSILLGLVDEAAAKILHGSDTGGDGVEEEGNAIECTKKGYGNRAAETNELLAVLVSVADLFPARLLDIDSPHNLGHALGEHMLINAVNLLTGQIYHVDRLCGVKVLFRCVSHYFFLLLTSLTFR